MSGCASAGDREIMERRAHQQLASRDWQRRRRVGCLQAGQPPPLTLPSLCMQVLSRTRRMCSNALPPTKRV